VRTEWQFPPSYNVAPTDDVPVVRVNKAGERTGSRLHWGLIPYWAKGVQPKFSTINATAEKLTEASSWRGPWNRSQRCILPALGFYEWQVQADGKSKQPFYITLNDQDVFGFVGLWGSSTGTDGVVIRSCTIVTMPANLIDPNRPDGYWGVCYILLRRRRVPFPSNRYLQGCRDRLNGRPPSMS
jgi:putative SOS response-associated peptidase YedK